MSNSTIAAISYTGQRPITPGSVWEILPAYSSETRSRSIFDEIAGCEATVVRILPSGDVEVTIKAMPDTWFVWWARLKGA